MIVDQAGPRGARPVPPDSPRTRGGYGPRLAFAALGALALVGCGEDTEPLCGIPAEPAVEVHVTESTTGRALDAGVEVVAVDGSFREVLHRMAPGVYTGLDGRAGRYDVTVGAPGYVPIAFHDVVAPARRCGGVRTQFLDAVLTPLPGSVVAAGTVSPADGHATVPPGPRSSPRSPGTP